eukprot:CAMPEP_0202884936 /NCGR_PEP_ID=MMETSP1391-20130828/41405_1 /ASSEMBLY_ACC=CAM_ASM_000867 /TAXON_ID=1034604 /ORGANISM="Chlamydomonas leiostraca, Strain SAG 11-49" /LENGTH=202 /DNA_ID=CAMNT_0049568169 /DNA_START=976 /DNA_END=1581 /DNA_ORIENTATION=-
MAWQVAPRRPLSISASDLGGGRVRLSQALQPVAQLGRHGADLVPPVQGHGELYTQVFQTAGEGQQVVCKRQAAQRVSKGCILLRGVLVPAALRRGLVLVLGAAKSVASTAPLQPPQQWLKVMRRVQSLYSVLARPMGLYCPSVRRQSAKLCASMMAACSHGRRSSWVALVASLKPLSGGAGPLLAAPPLLPPMLAHLGQPGW